MSSYDAVVYDLDGTLVRLDVDWDVVAGDVLDVYEAAGAPVGDGDLWTLLEDAPEHGIDAEVQGAIAEHERRGARESTRLPLADELAALGGPAAVCSLNCEAAARTALEIHDLDDRVGAVVGRDTVDGHKPDPEPLLTAIERIGADPDRTVFVGDSERDAVTAERAGVDFEFVRDRTGGR